MRMLNNTVDEDILSIVDKTAVILMNLKNVTAPSSPVLIPARPQAESPSAPPATASSPTNEAREGPCGCMLCSRGCPVILSKCHTWAWIMRVVFYSLRDRSPEKKFFSLRADVYDYMKAHWTILGLDRKPSTNWHKQIQDMLSHSRNIFESGMQTYKQNGYWRLRDLEDPWTASPDTPRPPSTSSPSGTSPLSLSLASALSAPGSPRKRGWHATSSDSDDSIEEDSPRIPHKRARSPSSVAAAEALSFPIGMLSSSAPAGLAPPPELESRESREELDREVALLREQLQHMAESVGHVATDAAAPRDTWDETYAIGQIVQQLGSVRP